MTDSTVEEKTPMLEQVLNTTSATNNLLQRNSAMIANLNSRLTALTIQMQSNRVNNNFRCGVGKHGDRVTLPSKLEDWDIFCTPVDFGIKNEPNSNKDNHLHAVEAFWHEVSTNSFQIYGYYYFRYSNGNTVTKKAMTKMAWFAIRKRAESFRNSIIISDEVEEFQNPVNIGKNNWKYQDVSWRHKDAKHYQIRDQLWNDLHNFKYGM